MDAHEAGALVELERQGWDALKNGAGREFYDALLADGAVMVFPFGVMERHDAIDGMAQAQPWQDYRLDDVTVHPVAADIAVVAYRAWAQRDGDEAYEAMLASTYVRRNGDWRMVLHQHSPTDGDA